MRYKSFIFFLIFFLIASVTINSYVFFYKDFQTLRNKQGILSLQINSSSNNCNIYNTSVQPSYFLKVIDGENIYSSRLKKEIPFYDNISIKIYGNLIVFEYFPEKISSEDLVNFIRFIKNKFYSPKSLDSNCSYEYSFYLNNLN